MRAQEFESLKQSGEIEEARMGASDFDAAVAQGTTKGVLVGFEFEVLVPQATIQGSTQTNAANISGERVSKLFYENGIFESNNNFDDLSPEIFDQFFKLKTETQSQYPNAVEAAKAYKLQMLENAKAIFNSIPEKIRAKYIPSVIKELKRKRLDPITKQFEFVSRLGNAIFFNHTGKMESLGFELRNSIRTSWNKLFKLWLDKDERTVAKNLHSLFDFDPVIVYEKFKEYEDDEDSYDQDYDYQGAARILQPAVTQYFNATVNVFNSYHQSKKNLTDWYIEPDGSLKPNQYTDGAAEIVSPPLPASESMVALKQFYDMAQQLNLYTNDSTGLHINVSIPDQIDVLKLSLFLGDQYVLQQFGRDDSQYARGVQKRIQSDAPGEVDRRGKVKLARLQKLAQDATGFHTASISRSGKYISFRHAGGNYLADYAKIAATVGRFVRAMLIAADPTAYAKEYKSKLNKLTRKPIVQDTDVIMTLRKQGLPVYEVSIWQTSNSSFNNILKYLDFNWKRAGWPSFQIQSFNQNSAEAKQNILNNLRSEALKHTAMQTSADKFATAIIVPIYPYAIEEVRNSIDKGVNRSDNYNRLLGYGLIRKQIYPPNHPETLRVLKILLRDKFGINKA